jgi:hypothetical protein
MALDAIEQRNYRRQKDVEYVGIIWQADASMSKLANVINSGTAFHTSIGADSELDSADVTLIPARLLTIKQDIKDYADAL